MTQERAEPFLSAVMIVRDEEAVLGDCLASIESVVDEMVIADTGSTDRSREIGAAHGARLIDFPWRDDFAAARNAALVEARGQWILYIDADERLARTDKALARAALDNPRLIAARPWFRIKTGFTLAREFRLFRNDPRIRFRGAIHEKVSIDILRLSGELGLEIGEPDLLLEHIGYDGPQEHKHRRNLPLLRAELASRPDDVYNWHHLGRILEATGDEPGAHEAWTNAVAAVRRRGGRWGVDCPAYFDLLRLECARGGPAEALLVEAETRFPDNPLTLLWRGNVAMRARRYGDAAECFLALTRIDPERFSDPEVAFEKRLFGELAFAALGNCCFQIGDYGTSAAFYGKAAAADPGSLEYRAKAELARSRAAQTTAAPLP